MTSKTANRKLYQNDKDTKKIKKKKIVKKRLEKLAVSLSFRFLYSKHKLLQTVTQSKFNMYGILFYPWSKWKLYTRRYKRFVFHLYIIIFFVHILHFAKKSQNQTKEDNRTNGSCKNPSRFLNVPECALFMFFLRLVQNFPDKDLPNSFRHSVHWWYKCLRKKSATRSETSECDSPIFLTQVSNSQWKLFPIS